MVTALQRPRDVPADVTTLSGAFGVYEVPLRTRFRGVDSRQVALIEGPHGWGEFAAFPEYDDAEATLWLAHALELAFAPAVPLRRTRIPVNATVPAVAPDAVGEILSRFPGCTTIKIKVAEAGEGLAEDLQRVRAVLAAAPTARLRFDANGGYSPATAMEFLTAVLDLLPAPQIDYVEQPCRSVAELAALRQQLAARGLPVRIAADESIRRSDDPWAVVRAGAADAAVIKAPPLGGPRAVLDLAAQLPLPLTVSSALDTAVGMSAALLTAGALDAVDGQLPAAGLGTGGFFATDLAEPHRIEAGTMVVARRVPDPAALRDCAASATVRSAWQERIRRCLERLPAHYAAAAGQASYTR